VLVVAAVVPFLNEEWCLEVFLDSMAAQTRTPDVLVLVDDGSTDGSPEIAHAFAASRDDVLVLRRPPRPAARDRLAEANELRAFQWAVEQLELEWDVIAKIDSDLKLAPATFETVERGFLEDPRLGMAGARLNEFAPDGSLIQLESPPEHVEGATKFYRRSCWRDIAPLPAILGWDTIDEFAARMCGWRTWSFEVPGGGPVHLRRMGTHDPILRSFRRWGVCSYGYGAHPLHVALYGMRLMRRRRPRLIGGLNYYAGWAVAGLRREPRADPELREAIRREQLSKIGRRVRRLPRETVRWLVQRHRLRR
jgi:biofilm PGA synthesis N-glycosyltransferase PgaC